MAINRAETNLTVIAKQPVTSMAEEMRKTGGLNHQDKAERLEEIIQEAAQETRIQEEEMKAQEAEDDADLLELKAKLQTAQSMPKPDNKDEMIEYLTQRLENAMAAVATCETIITHERNNRKEMSQDLKERNATLKELIANEKKSLKDKVTTELDATLSLAVRERVQTQELYNATLAELQKKNSESDHLTNQHHELARRSQDQNLEIVKTQQMVFDLQQRVEQLESEKQTLEANMVQANEEREKAIQERADAAQALLKLDESRLLMNKLMGPQGPLSMSQRLKYLQSQPQAAAAAGAANSAFPPSGNDSSNDNNADQFWEHEGRNGY